MVDETDKIIVEVENEDVNEEVIEKDKENIEEEKQEVSDTNKSTKKEFVVTPVNKILYVNTNRLNVRSGPDTTYSSIGGLQKAAEVKITGKVDGWYRITYNKKVGYVKASYLVETKPVIETQTAKEPSVQISNVPQITENQTTNTNGTVLNNLIIINSRNNTLRYYTSGKLSRSYPCATGASSSPTPQGKFYVYNKIVNRPYYKLNIPGGAPNNPLGKRWLGLYVNGTKGTTYAIHGSNNESSIGKNVSKGCVRMHNADIEAFYDIVPVGTTVIIKSTTQSDKQIAAAYDIYID